MERYKIIRKLGEGGHGIAYLAMDRKTKEFVTLKCVKNKNNNAAIDSLKQEATILRTFEKDNLPKIVDEGDGYIAIRYIDGENLLDVLRDRGSLSEKEVLRISADLIEILRYLHERKNPVVYRDLKPSNIILKKDGHVALIDFGAARFYKKRIREDTVNLGTVGYAAPEQYGSLGQTNEQTDIYCLGMTMLQLLSGANLNDCNEVSCVRNYGIKNVSNYTVSVIEGCIKTDRDLRYKTLKEVEGKLGAVPKKIMIRRGVTFASAVIAAFTISMLASGIIVYAMPVKKAVANDIEIRLPFVRQRIYVARERIERYIEDFGKVNEK